MNALAAGWIKLRTLRSTWWALGVGVLTALALTALGASTPRCHPPEHGR
ncbi:hypothetical protein [Streptosporangium sandarakinum]